MGEHKSATLLFATGIIVAAFIGVLLFFGGQGTIDHAEDTVNKNWLSIFTQSSKINTQLAVVAQKAKETRIAPNNINSQFDDVIQEVDVNKKLFGTANTADKILTVIQSVDSLLKQFKDIGFTVDNYPALEEKQTYLKEYYLLLDEEKKLRLLIGEYRDSLDKYNSLITTLPLSLAAQNATPLISHFEREY